MTRRTIFGFLGAALLALTLSGCCSDCYDCHDHGHGHGGHHGHH